MTPSVSPQNALIDCAILAATVPAAVALILGSVWRPPRVIVVIARCNAVPNKKSFSASRPSTAATRENPNLERLALNADCYRSPLDRSPLFAQRGHPHRVSL